MGRKVWEHNSSSKDAQCFLRIKWMKAEKETKKAGACRHNHPVKSEWGKKKCLLVAPSRRAGISHSDYSLFGVMLHKKNKICRLNEKEF